MNISKLFTAAQPSDPNRRCDRVTDSVLRPILPIACWPLSIPAAGDSSLPSLGGGNFPSRSSMAAIPSSFERVAAGDAREELPQLLLVRIREFGERIAKI